MNHYYVAKNGQQEGPYSVDQIIEKITKKELISTDYIYDNELNDWVLLTQFQHTTQAFLALNENNDENKNQVHEQKEDNDSWFILKSENKYGPFTQLELIKMLQDKSLYEFDYVWKNSMSSWSQISELNEFSTESIRKLMSTDDDTKSEIFFRRRHARAQYGASIIVHNNVKVWRGNSLELSAGGAGIVMENENLSPGDTIYLHFKPGDGVPPFNVVCEVVSKKSKRESAEESKNLNDDLNGFRYGVKFNKIHYGVQKVIKEFASKKAA